LPRIADAALRSVATLRHAQRRPERSRGTSAPRSWNAKRRRQSPAWGTWGPRACC